MLLLFVDETSDSKFKDYFGLSIAIINSNFYQTLKASFHKILVDSGWDKEIEFKGSYLFSANSGCKDIPVDKRIEIASRILELNKSRENSRIKFAYFHKKSADHKSDYLTYLPLLLDKIIPPAKKAGGKDVIGVYCDRRTDLSTADIRKALEPTLSKRKYTLLENVVMTDSDFNTIGILYADIVGYLYARIDTISNDAELFDNIPAHELENNGKVRKLRTSKNLINAIKSIKAYTVKDKNK
jgi:hypothetical protein